MARLNSTLVLTLDDRVSGPARGVGRSLDRLEHQQGRFGRMTAAASVGMGRAQTMMLAGAGAVVAPLAGGLAAKEAITAAADFETQLVEIGKKGGFTADQLARIGEEAKALATSGRVASSFDDIMAGYNRAAAAGIPLAEMGKFVELTTKVGDAFKMSGEDASNAFLGFNKTIGLGFDRMERYADLINSLADSGIADEKQIVGFIDRAGASLKAAGLTREQIAALGATAANIKLPEDVAANTFSTLVNKLLSPGSPKAQKALAGIVGNIGDFNKLLRKDANKGLERFLEAVSKLDKFKGAELLGGFMGAGFDDEVMRIAAAFDEVRRNRELAEGDSFFGSLDKGYQARLKTFWSQWQVAKNALAELAIDAGTMGMPAVLSVLNTAKGVIADVDAGLKGFRAQVNLDEVTSAFEAVRELANAVGSLLGMGGSGSVIERTFDRLAGAANTIGSAVNLVKDGLQAVGLVAQDDDTSAQIQRRADNVVDGMTTGPLGHVPRGFYDVATHRFGGDMYGDLKKGQDRAVADAARTRGVSEDVIRNEVRQQARSRAGTTGRPYVDPFPKDYLAPENLPPISYPTQAPAALRAPRIPIPTLRPQLAEPVPTPRPDIAANARAEADRAARAFEDAGQRIRTAFDVTASPNVDLTSMRALNAEIAKAQNGLSALGAQARSVAASAASTVGRTSRVNYDGLNSDLTHTGF